MQLLNLLWGWVQGLTNRDWAANCKKTKNALLSKKPNPLYHGLPPLMDSSRKIFQSEAVRPVSSNPFFISLAACSGHTISSGDQWRASLLRTCWIVSALVVSTWSQMELLCWLQLWGTSTRPCVHVTSSLLCTADSQTTVLYYHCLGRSGLTSHQPSNLALCNVILKNEYTSSLPRIWTRKHTKSQGFHCV